MSNFLKVMANDRGMWERTIIVNIFVVMAHNHICNGVRIVSLLIDVVKAFVESGPEAFFTNRPLSKL